MCDESYMCDDHICVMIYFTVFSYFPSGPLLFPYMYSLTLPISRSFRQTLYCFRSFRRTLSTGNVGDDYGGDCAGDPNTNVTSAATVAIAATATTNHKTSTCNAEVQHVMKKAQRVDLSQHVNFRSIDLHVEVSWA